MQRGLKISGKTGWLTVIFIYAGLLIIPPLLLKNSEQNRLKGTRQDIAEDALRYKGSNSSNFDCSAFTKRIYRTHGILLPANANKQFAGAQNIISTPEKAGKGDLVFFRINSDRISHVGIYLGKYRFIHSPGKHKTIRIDSLDNYWSAHLAGFRSFFPEN